MARMMSEAAVRELRDDYRQSLKGWREPDGFLLPTEPDPKERADLRIRLRVAVETLDRVLGER